jgi:hypothetical protein
MRPTEFPEMNSVYGKGSKRFLPLPAHTTGAGHVITCWKPTIKDRIKILITGRIWCSQLTDKKGLQPQYLTANRLDIFTYEGKDRPFEAKVRDFFAKILAPIGIKIRKSSEFKITRTPRKSLGSEEK